MAEYSIEINTPDNGYVTFNPTGDKLRGRWDFSRTAHMNISATEGVFLKEISLVARSIPGIIIAVDTGKKAARLIDPLAIGEGQKMLDAINKILQKHGQSQFKAWSARETKLNIDELKEYLFWMRRLIDGGLAEVCPRSSTLPPLEDIVAMPGKRRYDPLCTGSFSIKPPDEHSPYGVYKWADEVPVGGKESPPA